MNPKRPNGKEKAPRRGKAAGRGSANKAVRFVGRGGVGGRAVIGMVPAVGASPSHFRQAPGGVHVLAATRGGTVESFLPPSPSRGREVDPDYLALIRRFPLRPIRDDADYAAAAEILDAMVTRDENDLTPGERDYLDALTRFVEDYDQQHHLIGPDARTPLARLKSLMDSARITPAALGDIIGSRPAASMILGGQRELSKAQIRRLAAHFKLDAGYFL